MRGIWLAGRLQNLIAFHPLPGRPLLVTVERPSGFRGAFFQGITELSPSGESSGQWTHSAKMHAAAFE